MVPEDELIPKGGPARALERPKIPGYRLERIIGRGATGVVWKAVQSAVERPVAVKILHPELVGTKRAIRRLQREARTGARLAHPSIISAIDLGEVDGLWWYAMELVVGTPLSKRLAQQGKLTEREALRLFSPLGDALQHAFENGVVHRDIKPANILVDTRGRARLVDLGLAFAEDDPMLTKSGGTLGTPHYISPEQARDPSSADTRSDIWSLGATMYHALCGVPPFEGESVAEILSGVLYQRVPEPRSHNPLVSKGMSLVLRKCLARDPARRYQEPDDLVRDLERLRERRNPGVRAANLDPVAGGRPAWLWPALISGLALMAFSGWVLSGRSWRAGDVDPADQVERGQTVDLEFLRRRFESGEYDHADTWLALVEIERAAGGDVHHDALSRLVRDSLDERLEGLLATVGEEFETLLAAGRFQAAADAIEGGLDRRLKEATGFQSLRLLPIVVRSRYQRQFNDLAQRLSEAREAAVQASQRRLEAWFEREFRQRLKSLKDARRWLQALEEIGLDRAGWFERAGIDGSAFSEAERESIFVVVEARRTQGRSDLLRSWIDMNIALKAFALQRHQELTAALELGQVRDAAGELERDFAARLALEGVEVAQIPEDWESCTRITLPNLAHSLRQHEAEVMLQYARSIYEDTEPTFEQLCRQRRFAEAADLWRTRRGEPQLVSIQVDCDLRLRECELLNEVLTRCARGLLALSPGERYEFYVGTTRTEGRVQVGADPLGRGFEIIPRAGVGIHLVPIGPAEADQFLMAAGDVERMAGLDPHALSDDDKLLLALFRFHEGNLDAALTFLPYKRLGDPLVADLHARIRKLDEGVQEQRSARQDLYVRAQRQIRIGARSLDSSSAAGLAIRIERFLQEFGDLVGEAERKEFEALASEARVRSAPTLESAYAPSDMSAEGAELMLSWRFDGGSPRSWQLGSWRWDGEGLSQAGGLGTEEVLSDMGALRLRLGPPLDLRSGVTIELDFAARSLPDRPGNTLIVHLAGYTLAILEDPRDQRLLIAGNEEADLLTRLDGREGWKFDGLPWGRDFQLRLKVGAGRVEVSIDGKILEASIEGNRVPLRNRMVMRPNLGEDQLEFRLRSVQPLRLLAARLIVPKS